MNVIPLSEFGLETVADASARLGKAPKTIQNWINYGWVPVVLVGTGRSAKFLVRIRDIDAFTPPGGGRPAATRKKPP